MSRKGNCWDNAVADIGSLKKGRIKKQIYRDRDLAAADVAGYIVAFSVVATSEARAPNSLSRPTKHGAKVSTESWELHPNAKNACSHATVIN